MKPYQYVVAAAPIVFAVCTAVQDKVPAKYLVVVSAVMAVAMYFMRSPKDGNTDAK